MKVCVIGPGTKFLSGISYFTWKLSSTLNATPILFRDMMPKFLFPGKERIGKVESKIKYEPHGLFLDWWNPWTWIKAVRECNRHDVVILEWWSVSVAHMYAFISLFCRQRIIVEVHELIDPLEGNSRLLRAYGKVMRWLVWGRAEKIVVHSKADFETINSSTELKNISIIPHGVYDQYEDLSKEEWWWDAPFLDPDDFHILFFGLVRKYKGVDYLVEAYLKSDIPKKVLTVAGEVWDELEISRRKAENNVIFIHDRYQSDTALEVEFSTADVVVLPYLRASSSGVAHIAIHYGLPIIATPVGGLAELNDYEGMFYVPVADSDAIAEKLQEIYSNYRNKRFPVPKRLEWSSIKEEWITLLTPSSTA